MDNKIIMQAIRCCADENASCSDCPLRNEAGCTEIIAKGTLEIIEEQQSRLDNYSKTIDRMCLRNGGI